MKNDLSIMSYKVSDLYEMWYYANEKDIEMKIGGETGLLPESERFQEKAFAMFLSEVEGGLGIDLSK